MVDITADHAMFVQREYFVSHGYDAMQVFILLVPYRDGTLIALSTDVVTDQIAGFGTGLLHRVGRKRVACA